MAKRIKALINPEVLTWARGNSGFSPEEAAQKLKTSVEKLNLWESGEEQPSLAKLRQIGHLYKRPIAVFYLPQPPRDFDALKDFRRVQDHEQGDFSPELLLEIRIAQERREALLDIVNELGEELKTLNLTYSLKHSPEKLARKIREILKISISEQQSWENESTALKQWIDAVESLDILVFQSSKVSISEMRGFAIFSEKLPIIVLNGKDSYTGCIFTLLHEFVHLLLGETGVSDLKTSSTIHSKNDKLEVFCNLVAAETVVPLEQLLSEKEVINYQSLNWDEATLGKLARRYRVSSEVILRRLLDADKTSQEFYSIMRRKWSEIYENLPKRKSTGGPSYPLVPIRNMGNLFLRIGLQAFHSDILNSNDISSLFNMKFKHIEKVENYLLTGSV